MILGWQWSQCVYYWTNFISLNALSKLACKRNPTELQNRCTDMLAMMSLPTLGHSHCSSHSAIDIFTFDHFGINTGLGWLGTTAPHIQAQRGSCAQSPSHTSTCDKLEVQTLARAILELAYPSLASILEWPWCEKHQWQLASNHFSGESCKQVSQQTLLMTNKCRDRSFLHQ